MRAIFINAAARTITEIDHSGNLAEMYATLGVELVEKIEVAPDADMWVDEEGAINGTDYGFQLSGRPYFGSALLLGFNDQGDCVALPARITPDLIALHVSWLVSRPRPMLEKVD